MRPPKAPNRALDRSAGSHSLAAVGQRERQAAYIADTQEPYALRPVAAGILVCLTHCACGAFGGSALAQTSVTASPSTGSEDVAAIREAAERFLRALDDFDWEPFRATAAPEPTVFFPFGDTPDRVTGQVAVEARWRSFFDEARARRPGPPHLNLKPRDIRT